MRAVSAPAWLRDRDGFRSSAWREDARFGATPPSEPPGRDEIRSVPVTEKGELFHLGLLRDGAGVVCEGDEEVADPGRLCEAVSALSPLRAELTVDKFTRRVCRDYVKWRTATPWAIVDKTGRARPWPPAAALTARPELGALQAALNWAHADPVLAHPVKVTFPEKPPPRDRWLTRREAAALLRAANPHLRRSILIVAGGRERDGQGPEVTSHALKHTAVARASHRGISLEDAADCFGAAAATLEGLCRAHSPDHQGRAASITERHGQCVRISGRGGPARPAKCWSE